MVRQCFRLRLTEIPFPTWPKFSSAPRAETFLRPGGKLAVGNANAANRVDETIVLHDTWARCRARYRYSRRINLPMLIVSLPFPRVGASLRERRCAIFLSIRATKERRRQTEVAANRPSELNATHHYGRTPNEQHTATRSSTSVSTSTSTGERVVLIID